MAPMLLEILTANIFNQFVKSKLSLYHTLSEPSKVIALLLGLHAFLYESGKWRPSILDSFKFMVFVVNSEETFNAELCEWQQKLKDSNFEYQPTVIAFGRDFENLERRFLVHFNGNFYHFDNIFRALEILLNMFAYFNMSYPAPNKSVFKFLMAKIYDSNEDLNANVKTLLNFFLN